MQSCKTNKSNRCTAQNYTTRETDALHRTIKTRATIALHRTIPTSKSNHAHSQKNTNSNIPSVAVKSTKP
jgi:predicted nucleic acid-binding protein